MATRRRNRKNNNQAPNVSATTTTSVKPFVQHESNKDRTARVLREHGYNSEVRDGVVMVELDDEQQLESVLKLFRQIGYDASYGYHIKRTTK